MDRTNGNPLTSVIDGHIVNLLKHVCQNLSEKYTICDTQGNTVTSEHLCRVLIQDYFLDSPDKCSAVTASGRLCNKKTYSDGLCKIHFKTALFRKQIEGSKSTSTIKAKQDSLPISVEPMVAEDDILQDNSSEEVSDKTKLTKVFVDDRFYWTDGNYLYNSDMVRCGYKPASSGGSGDSSAFTLDTNPHNLYDDFEDRLREYLVA